MSVEYFLSQLMNGLCQGAIYALMAIGYSVIVGVVGMVTFTYGEIMMLGAFSAYYVFLLVGNNLPLMIIAAFAGSFLVGMAVYKICYERFFNAPRHISLLCTIGFSILVKNLAQIIFGPDTKPLQNVIDNRIFTMNIFGANVQIKLLQIIIIALVIFFAVALTLFFNRTKWGVMLRAVSQNREASYLVGINVKRVTMMGNCIGCAFGGLAGILLAINYYFVYPTMGSAYSIKAFSSSVLGGLVDLRFSALGGLCIGVIENMGISFSSASFRDIYAFGFLILVLIFRPQGFASKKGSRV